MPATYTLISSNVLSSSAASITFSAIPSTYTDLVIKGSGRTVGASNLYLLKMTINNDTNNIYGSTLLYGSGSSAASARDSNGTNIVYAGYLNGGGTTSNTFSSFEIYVPSYTATQNRSISSFAAQENNNTEAYIQVNAGSYGSTTTISRLDLFSTENFASGSSFYLYGISNA
jgi:hypothetical protein